MSANPMDLSGSTVLVTGASSGIGRETATLLSSLNARVVVAGRNQGRLEGTFRALEGDGHRMEVFDLSRTSDIPAWLKSVVNAVGPLSGMVHCAGIQATSPVKFITCDAAEALLRTNLLSSIMLMRAFSQRGCRAAESSVVLVSSVMALTGSPATSVYGASKAALIGFAKSLAVELAPERVRVNCIAPGFVQTEMLNEVREFFSPEQFEALGRAHPLGIGCPRDVANAAAFLLAGTGRWITGTTLVVDGGYTAH